MPSVTARPARFHRLRRGRVRTALDDGDLAEDLAGAEQLEHDVLAAARVLHDLHATGLHDAEPAGGIAFHEHVVARAVAVLTRAGGERVEVFRGQRGEAGSGAKDPCGVVTWHSGGP